MRILALVGLASAAACSQQSDPGSGPIILECNGTQTVQAFQTTTESKRYTYRIDGSAKTFEIWNAEQNTWKTWGDDRKLTIEPATITYEATKAADGGAASRRIVFNRSSGTVADDINVLPMGELAFAGACKIVTKPAEIDRQF